MVNGSNLSASVGHDGLHLACTFSPANTRDSQLCRPNVEAFEISGVGRSDLVAGSEITCRSPLEDAGEIAAWDDRITVVDQFPLYRNIPRDPSLSESVRQFMDYTDEKGRIKIFHLRVRD